MRRAEGAWTRATRRRGHTRPPTDLDCARCVDQPCVECAMRRRTRSPRTRERIATSTQLASRAAERTTLYVKLSGLHTPGPARSGAQGPGRSLTRPDLLAERPGVGKEIYVGKWNVTLLWFLDSTQCPCPSVAIARPLPQAGPPAGLRSLQTFDVGTRKRSIQVRSVRPGPA